MNEPAPRIRTLVFDLDGTLIDSAPDIHAAANRLMSELALPQFDLATITSFIGNGIPKLVERCLTAAGDAAQSVSRNHALERFNAFYAEEPTVRTRPYRGVVEALERLSSAGCRLGIVTNKSEALSHAVLADLGLAHRFNVLIGGDTLATRKPDPAGLLLGLRRLGGAAADVLYVGDSEVDAETAVRGGVRFALFTGGYRKSAISDIPHWYAFDDMRELLKDRIFADVTRSLQAG